MTLDQVPVGSAVKLTDMSSHVGARRLAELGLRPGVVLTVMRRVAGGGRLVGIGAARLALDRPTARALHVVQVAR